MIHQGNAQMGKARVDEKMDTIEGTPRRPARQTRKSAVNPKRRNGVPMAMERYNGMPKQYAIMTLPSGLILVSFILVYLYPYSLMGIVGVFMCLFVGFKYFILWLNELTDEIMKMLKSK